MVLWSPWAGLSDTENIGALCAANVVLEAHFGRVLGKHYGALKQGARGLWENLHRV